MPLVTASADNSSAVVVAEIMIGTSKPVSYTHLIHHSGKVEFPLCHYHGISIGFQVEMCIRDSIDPIAIREALEERGIVNGQVADPEKLDNDPFIQQVRSDAEQIADAETEQTSEAVSYTHLDVYKRQAPC